MIKYIKKKIKAFAIYVVKCSFFIWVNQKFCKHKNYTEGNYGNSMYVRVCDRCDLMDVEQVLSRRNGFIKIK